MKSSLNRNSLKFASPIIVLGIGLSLFAESNEIPNIADMGPAQREFKERAFEVPHAQSEEGIKASNILKELKKYVEKLNNMLDREESYLKEASLKNVESHEDEIRVVCNRIVSGMIKFDAYRGVGQTHSIGTSNVTGHTATFANACARFDDSLNGQPRLPPIRTLRGMTEYLMDEDNIKAFENTIRSKEWKITLERLREQSPKVGTYLHVEINNVKPAQPKKVIRNYTTTAAKKAQIDSLLDAKLISGKENCVEDFSGKSNCRAIRANPLRSQVGPHYGNQIKIDVEKGDSGSHAAQDGAQ